MNKTVISALLLFVMIVVAATGMKLLLPKLEDTRQKSTTDAGQMKGKITVALDSWVGYFILRSPEMKTRLRNLGYTLVVEDDRADYATRMERLKNGDIDFAAVTVDSFILNAAPLQFPGAIVMVLDESRGGDAILARRDRVADLNAMKDAEGIRVAFTPGSPSHHLAKAAADHFNVRELLPSGSLLLETEGSEQAAKALLEGRADVAICWEPDVSRLLQQKDIIKLLGTEDTKRLIVDVLVAGRRMIQRRAEEIPLFLKTYFEVLKHYRENPDQLLQHLNEESGLTEDAVQAMLNGVEWVGLNDNCEKWLGIAAGEGRGQDGLYQAMEATVKILISAGDFQANPIPDANPHRLTNRSFIEPLYRESYVGFTSSAKDSASLEASLSRPFRPLSDAQWALLSPVGNLKLEPVLFQQGSFELDTMAKEVLDDIVARLKHYPNFRLVIEGHTDTRGDALENQRLSQQRADAVARHLVENYGLDRNRIRSLGLGGSRPLVQKPEESLRAWRYRLPRLEMVLVRESL